MATLGSISVENVEIVQDSLKKIPLKSFPAVKDAFRKAVLAAHVETSKNLSGTPMESRTGLLRKSLQVEVVGNSLKDLRASFYSAGLFAGTPVVYAAIHEYGGTVKAKNAYKNVPGGPYLNIPTKSNQTAAGVTRFSPKDVFDKGGYIAQLRSRSKYGVFLDGDLMYILIKEVKIPARLGMRAAADAAVPGLLDDLRKLQL